MLFFVGFVVSVDVESLKKGVFDVFPLVMLIYSWMSFMFFIVLYTIKFAKRRSKKDLIREQLTKIDFEKEKEYYREILSENSPLVLGYLDTFELDKNKLIAELLYLKHKNIINIENERINLLIDDFSNLSYCDKFVCEKIQLGRLNIGNSRKFYSNLEMEIIKDANSFENALLKKKLPNNRKIVILSIVSLVFFLLYLYDGLWMSIQNIFTVVIIRELMKYLFIFFLVYTIKYKIDSDKIYERTASGEEINKKLEGLKIYLKDYSMLDERESNTLELWEEYLIYSVMFGQNKKIVEEYEKYIEIK